MRKWSIEKDNTRTMSQEILPHTIAQTTSKTEESFFSRKHHNQNDSRSPIGERTNATARPRMRDGARTNNVRKMKKILEDENAKFGLIYAPTQVGKTKAASIFIKKCFQYQKLVIFSTDDKEDQMVQTLERFQNLFETQEETISILCLKTLSNKKFQKILIKNLQQKIPTVILLMNNSSQIRKMFSVLLLLYHENKKIPSTVLFHDEGDAITKDKDISVVEENQAVSHQAWIHFVNFFVEKDILLQRVFITATPENVVMKYQITNVISLAIPSNYQGFDKIEYKELKMDNIQSIFEREIENIRAKKTNGIILYNVERVREGNNKKSGHDRVMSSVHGFASDVVISIYNGLGITAYFPKRFRQKFKKKMHFFVEENQKLKTKIQLQEIQQLETIEHYFQIKNLSIGWFYQFCKDIGVDIVITIGCDLMNRGISYCSCKRQRNALSATTMIYCPGVHRHCVGLVQVIGRLTGTVRPDLARTLYAPSYIIEDYQKTCENERDFIEGLQNNLIENEETNSEEFFKNFYFKETVKRSLDRPKLNLQPLFRKSTAEETEDSNEKIDGVSLKTLEKLCNGNTITFRIIQYLMQEEEPVSFQQLMDGIEYTNKRESFLSNLKNGREVKSQYGMIWTTGKNYQQIQMNPKIRDYLLKKNL